MSFRGASEFLRLELEAVGITLDEPTKTESRLNRIEAVEPVDAFTRAEIRGVLIAAGAPHRDLAWLTASCPSIGHAMAYRPPVESPQTHRNRDPHR